MHNKLKYLEDKNMTETRLLKINGKLVCDNCKYELKFTQKKCPLCGKSFYNVATNDWEYKQLKEAEKLSNQIDESVKFVNFWSTIILFIAIVLFIITIINSLLCIFVYHNFTIDLFFLVGIIVPILYTIFWLIYIVDI